MSFFFIIWANPKFYQTLIFLAQHLSKKNCKVFILARKPEKQDDIIEAINFGKNTKIIYSPKLPFFCSNSISLFIFIFFCLFHFIFKKPKKIIFFNKSSLLCLPLMKIFKKTVFIYHNFDFELIHKVKSYKQKFLLFLEIQLSHLCKYLIFPSQERANIFKKISKNRKSFFFEFKNCFPKLFKPKKSNKLTKLLKNHNLKKKKIICYLGSVGPAHFLEEVIDSVMHISDRFILIIAGSPINKYPKKLRRKINTLNLSNKIYILENIKNSLWFEILYKSSLGLCFYKKTNLSHTSMAGTSQKFNNYVLANIPMIVNHNKDFLNFKKKFDIFETVDPKYPKKIAKKINFVLKNKKVYSKLKSNLKESFLQELNFEEQFQKSYKKFL
tara:strand:+ start:14908 stop:16059 length:1152 start_codon:yes stop_codon:yes gene_type:complete